MGTDLRKDKIDPSGGTEVPTTVDNTVKPPTDDRTGSDDQIDFFGDNNQGGPEEQPVDSPDTPAPDRDTTPTGPPDYSGEADDIRGDGSMDYAVPGVTPVDTPMSSGTADPTMTPWNVNPDTTVMGLSDEYYDRNSPFFENARQRAIRQHLSGGGQNSAMAAGFGELAAMDVAFKAAQQDAATYARSDEFNASMANQFSLAEQRFIHNAMLSDQAFDQAASLQTQRIAAQLESIVLDYKGRNQLMDKELDQWFLKAKQEYAYSLGKLGADMDASMRVNSMTQLTNFYISSFESVMEAANNPNLTPEQSAAAMREGMAYANQQWQFLSSFLGAYGNAAGSDPYDWLGNSSFDPNNWANFSGG